MTPDKAELEKWHKYFAIENNNIAWNLASKPMRTTAESAEMMHAAHASALHWGKIGTELNIMRATMLLAEVHALKGLFNSSLAYAEKVSVYFEQHKPYDWELAFVHTIHAHAAAVAGRKDLHASQYHAAKRAIEAIADEEDRKIVLQTFNQVSVP